MTAEEVSVFTGKLPPLNIDSEDPTEGKSVGPHGQVGSLPLAVGFFFLNLVVFFMKVREKCSGKDIDLE